MSYKNYGNLLDFKYDLEECENAGNKLHGYVQFYRKYGHLSAFKDPLGLCTVPTDAHPSPLDFHLKYDTELDA
jgi:2-oxoglutarate dehydrogenase complex dehydrogenase (E1) component-like enzyme